MSRARRSGGFVLVNALVLVAALAAVAVLLLARAESARALRATGQTATQLTLYLDAFESLAITVLEADAASPGGTDNPGEPWAGAEYNVPLDRGRVAGRISDLQGRFNVNWLADPSDTEARAGFDALALRLGLAPRTAEALVAFLSPGGPADKAAYAALEPPVDPVGGAILALDQLRIVPGLRAEDWQRLSAVAAALPGDSLLNVNTAPPEVLRLFLPGVSPARLDRLVQERTRQPFLSVEDFITRLTGQTREEAAAAIDPDRFTVSSTWFEVTIEAALEDRGMQRRTVLARQPLPLGVRVIYRLDQGY